METAVAFLYAQLYSFNEQRGNMMFKHVLCHCFDWQILHFGT